MLTDRYMIARIGAYGFAAPRNGGDQPYYFAAAGNGGDGAVLFHVAGAEATVPMFAMGEKPQAHTPWRTIDLLARIRPLRLTEIEQDEEHCLEAMLHWRDPAERSRTLRCRSHTLAEDNPASG